MKKKAIVVAVGIALASLGCNLTEQEATPTEYVSSTNTPPGGSGPESGLANVESVEILILESFPVQISVLARGNHPDGCTSIDEIDVSLDGNTFLVVITTIRPGDESCTTALVPFEENISLDVLGLPAGVYTVDVNEVDGTFELTVDNVVPQEGSIGGVVWHDECATPWGDPPPTPPEGCVVLPDSSYLANGVLEPSEQRLAGVVVSLGAAACPATGTATMTTAADGSYLFTGLVPGTYCLSVDALHPTNETILIPGAWTQPPGEAIAEVTVTLTAGEENLGVNFGWDFQFLPAP